MVATPQSRREALRRMVDELDDEDVERAHELLARLRFERLHAEAPEEDEPVSAEEAEAIREAEEDLARGDVLTDAELARELGLDE